jgi:hypothetical protein
MEIGQIFKSRSKVQTDFVTYQYAGILLPSGRHLIKAMTGNAKDDCEVDSNWFENRTIIMAEKPTIKMEV